MLAIKVQTHNNKKTNKTNPPHPKAKEQKVQETKRSQIVTNHKLKPGNWIKERPMNRLRKEPYLQALQFSNSIYYSN